MNFNAGVTTLGVFLLTQFTAWVWWAAKISTLMKEIEKDIKDITRKLDKSAERFADIEHRLSTVESRCSLIHGELKRETVGGNL